MKNAELLNKWIWNVDNRPERISILMQVVLQPIALIIDTYCSEPWGKDHFLLKIEVYKLCSRKLPCGHDIWVTTCTQSASVERRNFQSSALDVVKVLRQYHCDVPLHFQEYTEGWLSKIERRW